MLARFLIAVASALAPREVRSAWRAEQNGALGDLLVLAERGEFPASVRRLTTDHCRQAFVEAFWLRFNREQWARFIRGPAFVFAAAGALILLAAAASRGFAGTRFVVHLAKMSDIHSVRRNDPFGAFLTYAIPIVFALIVGITIILVRGPRLRGYGWRYTMFFSAKTAIVLFLVPVLWIELIPALRQVRPSGELGVIVTALLSRLVFIAAFGLALGWCFADQRARCPVCLRRLSFPVRLGSWASVFDPVTTEVVCEDGHGALALGESDRWVKLDDSWSELFTHR